MSRMLSALRVLDRRPGTPLGVAGIAVGQSRLAEPGLPAGSESPLEPDDQWSRFETNLSNASSLAHELLADELLGAASANIPAARFGATAPVWELPSIDPAPACRKLALQLAQDAGVLGGLAPLLFAAVRGAAMDALNLLELAVALGEAGDEVLIVDLQRNAPQGTIQSDPAPQCGLNQMLSARATWSDIIRPTSLRGISFVGSGRPEPFTSPWQDQAGRIWKQLPGEWRHVLVSGGAFDRPLTLAMAGVCRSTYLIVELGAERTSAISSALSALRAAGASVRGAIALDDRRPQA